MSKDERTEAEARLVASFADELPAAIWVGRVPGGECVYVNAAFERILGMGPPEDATRGNYAATYSVHKPDGAPYPEHEMPYERAVAAGGPVVVDDIVIHRGEERTHLRVFAKPLLDAGGEVTHVVEAFTDITREVAAERARAEGERRILQGERTETIGRLAGGVAHDFNNMLATLQLLTARLKQGERDPGRLEAFGDVEQILGSAAQLTRSLLGFARLGRHLVQPVSLNDVVGRLAALTRRTVEPRFRITCELGARSDLVLGDPSQLEQVVMNLVLNARDAVPEGPSRIALRTSERLSGEGGGRYVVLEVEDDGAGVPPALRDRIFEPYFTTKVAGVSRGTGLGLATVRGVVEGHGGFVEVDPAEPRGAIFRVLFPASPEEAKPPPAVEPRGAGRGAGTILVIEDDAALRRATAIALQDLGYEVLLAEDGTEGLELLRSRLGSARAIRSVVLDLRTPRLSGREACLALRAEDPDLGLVVTTGHASNEEAQALVELGRAVFLPKPYDAAALSEALGRIAAESRAPR